MRRVILSIFLGFLMASPAFAQKGEVPKFISSSTNHHIADNLESSHVTFNLSDALTEIHENGDERSIKTYVNGMVDGHPVRVIFGKMIGDEFDLKEIPLEVTIDLRNNQGVIAKNSDGMFMATSIPLDEILASKTESFCRGDNTKLRLFSRGFGGYFEIAIIEWYDLNASKEIQGTQPLVDSGKGSVSHMCPHHIMLDETSFGSGRWRVYSPGSLMPHGSTSYPMDLQGEGSDGFPHPCFGTCPSEEACSEGTDDPNGRARVILWGVGENAINSVLVHCRCI